MNLKVLSLALLLALPLVSTGHSASSSVSIAMDAEAYSASSTLLGEAPLAQVAVADSAGQGLAGVEVRVVFLRIVPLFGYASNETVLVTTDASGVASVPAPQLSTLPGDYMVVAFAAGSSGSDRYTIGA